MPEYLVVTAVKKKDVDGRNGPMQVINLVLDIDGKHQAAEWFTKASTALPAPGEKVDGTLEASQYGLRFKKAFKEGGGGFRPRDPKESAKITRQHSQEMALRYATLRHAQERLPEDFQLADLFKIADHFDADVERAGARFDQHKPPVRNEPQPSGKPDATTPADYPVPDPADAATTHLGGEAA